MTPAGLTRLQNDEGKVLTVYNDTRGVPTIGYGRNLRDVGISDDEATLLLTNDLARCEASLAQLPWFAALNPVRQDVLVNLCYNLGAAGLFTFHKTLTAMSTGDWSTAAEELMDSNAARELPARYGRLRDALLSSAWA